MHTPRAPSLSVVVISRGRPLRLRWLLDALEGDHQVVETRLQPWRVASGDVVALVREDCLPAPGWTRRALEVAARHPDAVVQGSVRPDPHQVEALIAAPDMTALSVTAPAAWAPLANVVARRDVLARVLEDPGTGEPADGARLWAAARRAGVPWVHDQALLAWSSPARPEPLRGAAAAVRHDPALRRELVLGLFTSRAHARLAAAVAGAALGPAGTPLLLPWLLTRTQRDGAGARGRARALARLPARTARDARSLAVALAGSASERTLVL